MRIGLFGGTFNPVHWGHLLMAEAAREAASLDQVLFLPTGRPPHKPLPGVSAADRLAMLRLATRSHPAFRVSAWEIRQRKTVYTVDALNHFRSLHPNDRLFFILGSDSLRDIPQWREGPRLLSLATFLAIDRPEAPWSSLPVSLRRRARRVDAMAVPVASRDIRERVRRGRSIRYRVPEAVEAYIQENCLYKRKAA